MDLSKYLYELDPIVLGILGIVLVAFLGVLLILVLLTPFFIYRIRNELIKLNEQIGLQNQYLEDLKRRLGVARPSLQRTNGKSKITQYKCPYCQTLIDEDYKICPHCRRPMPPEWPRNKDK